MPFGDGTGPAGQGPMTGRRLGRCAGNDIPGNGFFGRGLGRGWGRGFGFGRGYGYNQAPVNEASEKSWLDNVINVLKNQLENFEKRRNDLDK